MTKPIKNIATIALLIFIILAGCDKPEKNNELNKIRVHQVPLNVQIENVRKEIKAHPDSYSYFLEEMTDLAISNNLISAIKLQDYASKEINDNLEYVKRQFRQNDIRQINSLESRVKALTEYNLILEKRISTSKKELSDAERKIEILSITHEIKNSALGSAQLEQNFQAGISKLENLIPNFEEVQSLRDSLFRLEVELNKKKSELESSSKKFKNMIAKLEIEIEKIEKRGNNLDDNNDIKSGVPVLLVNKDLTDRLAFGFRNKKQGVWIFYVPANENMTVYIPAGDYVYFIRWKDIRGAYYKYETVTRITSGATERYGGEKYNGLYIGGN